MAQTKIATCCYCGTRAALVLTGDIQHELCCSRCGAALHNLKHLPKGGWGEEKSKPIKSKKVAKSDKSKYSKPKKKKKKKKTLGVRLLDEVFDGLDDLF